MNRGEATASPPYPTRHAGPVIVIGSAWCASEDFENALALFPGAYICGINRTVKHFDCDAMVAVDRGRAEHWKAGSRVPVTLHGGRFGAQGGPEAYPWFDYWWPELQAGGTSVWLACKIAYMIGFEQIIVAGAPLMPGPYLDGTDDWSHRDEVVMAAYRGPWVHDTWMHPYVRSLSGWTRELLGAP